MKRNQTIQKLVAKCTNYLEHHNFSKRRVEQYKFLWRIGICHYMEKNNLVYYNRSVGEEFILSTISSDVTAKEREMIRSIGILNDIQEVGKISLKTSHKVAYELTGKIGDAIERLLSHLKDLRRSPRTVEYYLLYLYRFQEYLKHQKISSLNEIKEIHLLSFLSTTTNSGINRIRVVRFFFRYLFNEGILKKDISYVLDSYKSVNKEILPSVYTAEEIKQIETSVGRASPVGKRNYAVLLLTTRLGLRVSDIANLSFSHFDWANSHIIIEQQKTGKRVELPILLEVGEAIIAYLKYGRPKSQLQNIFLSARAPYRTMTRISVTDAVGNIIKLSGVTIGKRKHYAHSMRHSLASRLLENHTPLPIISESLGHRKTETTMQYLRIDIESLRKCALDVTTVSDEFYSQKGGVFYE